MGNNRAAEKRKPKKKRVSGARKAAGTGKNASRSSEAETSSRPKPRPLHKNPSISASDADAAELLMSLGHAGNDASDAGIGISPEEGAAFHPEEEGSSSSSDENDNVADDDDSEEEEEYTITYEVPFNNATRELKLPCTTTFSQFLTKVARKMEVSVTHLSAIGYIPSYKPKTPKPIPKLLETAEDFESLMTDITEYRQSCLKEKKGTVKPFSIHLSDTSSTPTDGRTKSTKKKGPQPAAPLEASERREHELIAEIEKHHACQEHTGKACYVQSSGEHYQYNNNDLVIWATLVRRDLAKVEQVPNQLKIEDKFNQQKKAKNALTQSQFNGGYGSMQWPPMQSPWMYNMLAPPWMMPGAAAGPSQAPAPVPSPSPPRKRKYPVITGWLQDLDSDEIRGTDYQDYQQYADVFDKIGIVRLDDLLAVGSGDKLQQLTGMKWGTANRLFKFAQEDERRLKKARIE
ncbi:hypothetical protein C8R45DRAFT_1115680 [Mycena sanguinolenta]|nr:hypothetical protein C8R45DRAFT_1115680 [Mycena sanguinolenta]